uniref:Uncharacterized protein n=1 Tax=Sphaeramia orbicularis TaxID=375764 RepID=A0A672ZY68_9TELE
MYVKPSKSFWLLLISSFFGHRSLVLGPDGIGDYRPRSNYFPQYISEGSGSPEATGDLSYLFRAAPLAPLSTPKQSYVGEIGWGWRYNQQLNGGTLLSNMQIKVRLSTEQHKQIRTHQQTSVGKWRMGFYKSLDVTENRNFINFD